MAGRLKGGGSPDGACRGPDGEDREEWESINQLKADIIRLQEELPLLIEEYEDQLRLCRRIEQKAMRTGRIRPEEQALVADCFFLKDAVEAYEECLAEWREEVVVRERLLSRAGDMELTLPTNPPDAVGSGAVTGIGYDSEPEVGAVLEDRPRKGKEKEVLEIASYRSKGKEPVRPRQHQHPASQSPEYYPEARSLSPADLYPEMEASYRGDPGPSTSKQRLERHSLEISDEAILRQMIEAMSRNAAESSKTAEARTETLEPIIEIEPAAEDDEALARRLFEYERMRTDEELALRLQAEELDAEPDSGIVVPFGYDPLADLSAEKSSMQGWDSGLKSPLSSRTERLRLKEAGALRDALSPPKSSEESPVGTNRLEAPMPTYHLEQEMAFPFGPMLAPIRRSPSPAGQIHLPSIFTQLSSLAAPRIPMRDRAVDPNVAVLFPQHPDDLTLGRPPQPISELSVPWCESQSLPDGLPLARWSTCPSPEKRNPGYGDAISSLGLTTSPAREGTRPGAPPGYLGTQPSYRPPGPPEPFSQALLDSCLDEIRALIRNKDADATPPSVSATQGHLRSGTPLKRPRPTSPEEAKLNAAERSYGQDIDRERRRELDEVAAWERERGAEETTLLRLIRGEAQEVPPKPKELSATGHQEAHAPFAKAPELPPNAKSPSLKRSREVGTPPETVGKRESKKRPRRVVVVEHVEDVNRAEATPESSQGQPD